MRHGPDTLKDEDSIGVLGPLAREFGRGLGARTSLLAIPARPRGPLDVVAAWPAVPFWDIDSPPDPDSFVGRASRTPRPLLEPVPPDDDSLGRPHPNAPVTFGAATPVRPFRAPAGILCAGFAAPPTEDVARLRWILDGYAHVAALCLAVPNTVHGLVLAARYDGTTGCLSQTAIHDELVREVQRAARHHGDLTCCFIDLDRFKQVNDRLGHLEGTRVLQRVATILRDGLRTTDSIGRFGGDEFVLILPDCTEAGGLELARRLHTLLMTPGATTPPGSEPVGASFGVAEWRPGMSADDLLAAADTALLSAKRNGGGTYATPAGGRFERTEHR